MYVSTYACMYFLNWLEFIFLECSVCMYVQDNKILQIYTQLT